MEKVMATHSRILAWRIPWTEEPGRLQSMEYRELDMTEGLISSSAKTRGFHTQLDEGPETP